MSVIEKWIKALRSGDFQQCRGALKTNKGYCCLGVLCELYLNDHPKAFWKKATNFVIPESFRFHVSKEAGMNAAIGTLPNEVVEWAGLSPGDPLVTTKLGKKMPLTSLNDGGVSFSEIATLIEEII